MSEERKLVTIFWSGGWDGTFRMCELAQQNVVVQPIYVSDTVRLSNEYERAAMDSILAELRKNAVADILDVIFFDVDQIKLTCADAEISEAAAQLAEKYELGAQYEWFALLCKKLGVRAEVGITGGTGRPQLAMYSDGRISQIQNEDRYEFVPNEEGSATDLVMGRFIYPIIKYTKKDMERIGRENGWLDIMKLSWFCHYPINGKPCGLCNPCRDAMRYGMEWRMPDESQERYRNLDRYLAPTAEGIPSVVKRIADHMNLYRSATGMELNLLEPATLNEKLQWLMVYRYDRNVSGYADKLRVREYVTACGYADILTRIYGVWEHAADIEPVTLPEQFVLKCNHGSGPTCYSVCADKGSFDFAEERKKLERALQADYARVGYEYQYSYIEPKVYAEELIGDGVAPLVDYKFFCFSGKAKLVKVIAGHGDKVQQDYYDCDWNFRPYVKDINSMGGGMKKPENFERMIEIASKLSEQFAMARVDLYNVDGRIYFGEITLTPATGLNRTDKPETVAMMGEWVDLSYKPEKEYFFKNEGMAGRTDLSELKATAGRLLKEEGLLANCSRDVLNAIMKDCTKILGSDADNDIKQIYLNVLYRAAFRDDMSLEECWQIYHDIDRSMFVNNALTLEEGSLNTLYRLIFDFVHASIDYTGKEFRPYSKRDGKRIVMLTSQFLRIGHAPTRRILDYSYVLQHELGYRVVIINDAGMNYYKSESLGDDIGFTFIEEFNDADTVSHKGETFEFFQVDCLMPDLGMLQKLIDLIYELNPVLVYNIGGSCLTSDLCDDFTTVCSLPCNFDLPVATCKNLLLGRPLDNLENVKNADILQNQTVYETVFNYVMNESGADYDPSSFMKKELADKYRRDELTIAGAVGYRLGRELDKEYIEMLGRLLAECQNTVVFLVGEIEESSPAREYIKALGDRVICTGLLKGAEGLIKHFDVILNPNRSGGGRSIFEANYYGIPAVSLRTGDGYCAGGADCGADDYDEYVRRTVRLLTDSSYRRMEGDKAKRRAGELADMTETQREVLKKVLG